MIKMGTREGRPQPQGLLRSGEFKLIPFDRVPINPVSGEEFVENAPGEEDGGVNSNARTTKKWHNN